MKLLSRCHVNANHCELCLPGGSRELNQQVLEVDRFLLGAPKRLVPLNAPPPRLAPSCNYSLEILAAVPSNGVLSDLLVIMKAHFDVIHGTKSSSCRVTESVERAFMQRRSCCLSCSHALQGLGLLQSANSADS